MTHTFVVLDVSPACYAEIRARLEAVEYQHTFTESDGKPVIDMHGIALRSEDDQRVRCYLVFEGKVVKPEAQVGLADRPAAKSSTSVLNASVCQACGHPLDGKKGASFGPDGGPCTCFCHEGA